MNIAPTTSSSVDGREPTRQTVFQDPADRCGGHHAGRHPRWWRLHVVEEHAGHSEVTKRPRTTHRRSGGEEQPHGHEPCEQRHRPRRPLKPPRKAALAKLAEAQGGRGKSSTGTKPRSWPRKPVVEGIAVARSKVVPAGQLESEKPNRNALEQAGKLLDSPATSKRPRPSSTRAAGTKLLQAPVTTNSRRAAPSWPARRRSRSQRAEGRTEGRAQGGTESEEPGGRAREGRTPSSNRPPLVAKADPRAGRSRGPLQGSLRREARRRTTSGAAVAAGKVHQGLARPTTPAIACWEASTPSLRGRDGSAADDREKARKYYERFIEVAPPDDDYVPEGEGHSRRRRRTSSQKPLSPTSGPDPCAALNRSESSSSMTSPITLNFSRPCLIKEGYLVTVTAGSDQGHLHAQGGELPPGHPRHDDAQAVGHRGAGADP